MTKLRGNLWSVTYEAMMDPSDRESDGCGLLSKLLRESMLLPASALHKEPDFHESKRRAEKTSASYKSTPAKHGSSRLKL